MLYKSPEINAKGLSSRYSSVPLHRRTLMPHNANCVSIKRRSSGSVVCFLRYYFELRLVFKATEARIFDRDALINFLRTVVRCVFVSFLALGKLTKK